MRAALAEQFPTLRLDAVRFLGSGWDYDAWLVDDGWVFRFPRRREVADGIPEELRGMELVSQGLRDAPLAFPHFEHVGAPGPHFPYAFLGYRFLPGTPGPEVPPDRIDRAQVVEALGETLRLLHAIPAEQALERGIRRELDGQKAWLRDVVRKRDAIRDALPEALRERALPFLEGSAAHGPESDSPPRLIHNDLGPDHVLLDPETGRAVALLDFGDLSVGDPAYDFIGLPPWLGWRATRDVISAYGVGDTGLVDRVGFLSRACGLVWLLEASRMPEDQRARDVEKHTQWLGRTLDPGS
ncbi:MAG: phosphotransferase [Myxococcota bacterium]|nr:phosphotransferase [Myxococcota bacterium]